MANPVMGEISFESGGKSYIFKLGTYAQALLERRVKMPAAKFFQRAEDAWGVDDILSVLWAGLFRAHKLTEEAVADLVDELGFERVGELIRDAIGAAAPADAKALGSAQPEAPANPPAAEA